MNDRISLCAPLMDRLVRVLHRTTLKTESIARKAIAGRLAYREWESRALAIGRKDLDQGRTLQTSGSASGSFGPSVPLVARKPPKTA
jgi:predicted transcriptional regulator